MITNWFATVPPLVDEAKRDDFAELADLHGLSFAREWSEEEIAALMSGKGVFALVARRGSLMTSRRPIGFVLVRGVADEAEILTIAVHPRHRGRGLGKLLMEAAMRRLYADRILNLFLEVDANNAAARALYERIGFKIVGERKGYYATGSAGPAPALVMRYEMRPPPPRPRKGASS